MNVTTVVLLVLAVQLSVLLLVSTLYFVKKSKVVTGLQIQSSSGDSEVMSFNVNFNQGESEDSKTSKVFDAFQRIQNRRDENHAKFLQIKADAIKENEAKVAEGQDLKLKSVTQEG